MLLPAFFVAYTFGDKLLEVLYDPSEFAAIISVVPFLVPVSGLLAYAIGIFDACVAAAVLIVPSLRATKKYAPYVFGWVTVWPFVPSSMRYFGGVAEFEIVEVVLIVVAALAAWWLWQMYAAKD